MSDLERIYLDNNATTRPYPEVVEVMAETFLQSYADPGSRHGEGRQARQALENARESLANSLGAEPKEVVFTSGGTESTNMVLFGLMSRAPGENEPKTIALTAGEHPATVESCQVLESQGWKTLMLDVNADGRLDSGQYDGLPWDDLKLVTVILAHNETGVIQDLGPLSKLCAEHSVALHVDAVQAVGKIPVDFHELGATFLSLGAHKFHGPRGIGALLMREGAKLTPTLFGGHQEGGKRPGTEPVALIAGMAKALEIWNADRESRMSEIASLRDQLEAGLRETCEPVVVNGSAEYRLPNTLNISFPGLDGDAMLVAFDLEGVSCSLGSTCSSGSTEPAPSLVAMGCEPEVYKSAVRFSVGIENTPEQIDEAVSRISTVISHLRQTGNGNG